MNTVSTPKPLLDKKYRVEIVKDDSGEVVSVIGRRLSAKKAETREEAGWNRINANDYSVRTVEEDL